MPAQFKFDQGAIDRVVQDAMRGAQHDLQRSFDDLGRRYRGRPVNEVKVALRDVLRRGGGNVGEPELTEWATAISEGTRIVLKL